MNGKWIFWNHFVNITNAFNRFLQKGFIKYSNLKIHRSLKIFDNKSTTDFASFYYWYLIEK